MSDKYYIPNLPEFLKRMGEEERALIVRNSTNIIEFNSNDAKLVFLDKIKQIDFVNAKELQSYFQENLPDVAPYLDVVPISIEAIRNTLSFIFDELPTDLLEKDSVIIGLQKLFNHEVRKNEITFIAINTSNGKLKYVEDYKYGKFQEFYFQMMKLGYNLDTYYDLFCRAQSVLRNVFVKEVLFSDSKLGTLDQNLLNRIFNLAGNHLQDYKYRLESAMNQIEGNRKTLKRTGIPLPSGYDEVENDVKRKIETSISDIDKKIEENYNSKKQLAEELRKRHGLISLETLKKILKEIKWFKPFIKE